MVCSERVCSPFSLTGRSRAVGREQLCLNVLVAGKLVEPGDNEIGLAEPVPVAAASSLSLRENVESEMEPTIQLVLPLLGQAAWADNQAPLQIAARNHLFHQEAGHDRPPGAGVV